MAVYDKIQRSLLGKCCLPSRGIALTQALQSISGKVPCPKGEQFENGGFEEADFTGWTRTGNGNRWDACTTDLRWSITPSVGTYMAMFSARSGDSNPVTGTLTQEFLSPIPVACFTDDSIFDVDTNWIEEGCPGVPPEIWKVEILYIDGTSTEVDLTGDPGDTWTTHDLKSVLEEGKTVKGIKFTAKVEEWSYYMDRVRQEVFIDACTLKI